MDRRQVGALRIVKAEAGNARQVHRNDMADDFN
jgi:hypothetical protein